jgi:hypothetical protein
LYSAADVSIADGYLDLQGRYVRMSGVPNGLSVTVAVEGGKLRQLEFAVYGEGDWNGEERTWSLTR